jgi:cytochrome c553
MVADPSSRIPGAVVFPRLGLLLVAGLLGLVACETPSPTAGDGLTTKERFQSCLLCHSTREMQRGPILNGLDRWYAEAQMNKFRSGIRGGKPENPGEHLMGTTGLQHLAHDREVKAMAQVIGKLQPVAHRKTVRGDRENGERIYQRCIACHGSKAEGKRLLKSPQLAYLEDWYLLDQMRKFVQGQRGYHAEDSSGGLMAKASEALGDQDLKDVTAYIVDTFGL